MATEKRFTAENFLNELSDIPKDKRMNFKEQIAANITQLVAGLIYMLKATSNACLFTLRDIY